MRLGYAGKDCSDTRLTDSSLITWQVLILLALLLLFNVWTVTAVTLRALVYLVLDLGAEVVLWSALLLGG